MIVLSDEDAQDLLEKLLRTPKSDEDFELNDKQIQFLKERLLFQEKLKEAKNV